MKYVVTPFTLSNATLEGDPIIVLVLRRRKVVLPLAGYDERVALEIDAVNPAEACERLWTAYQNVDAVRRTVDGGRSLMTGDMARVTDDDGREEWWLCCALGWTETPPPAEHRIEMDGASGRPGR